MQKRTHDVGIIKFVSTFIIQFLCQRSTTVSMIIIHTCTGYIAPKLHLSTEPILAATQQPVQYAGASSPRLRAQDLWTPQKHFYMFTVPVSKQYTHVSALSTPCHQST